MHITSRAPLLSATESLDCICIILLLRLLSPLQHFYNVPGLGFGNGPNMLDAHSVALTAIIYRDMGMNLTRATNVLSVQQVLQQSPKAHGDRTVPHVTGNLTGHGTMFQI